MAYAVEKGSQRFAGTGGVILVHLTLAYLVVFGLTPPGFIKPPETRITGVPVTPPDEPPPPKEQPKDQPKTEIEDPVYVPDDPFKFTTDDAFKTKITEIIVPPIGDPVIHSTGGTRGDSIEATLFTPKLARPINDVLRWVTTNDYPRISINREEQGIVRFSVSVDAKGKVTDCSITRSSGSAALDEATCKNVKKRARFEPAIDKYGVKVSGTYSNSVNWVLPE